MTGVLLLRETEGASQVSPVGPTAPSWSNIYGVGFAQTNIVTMAGLSGQISIAMSWSGSGLFYYVKNGALYLYLEFGAFSVENGDEIGFGVQNPDPSGSYAGTITITDATHSTTLKTLTYLVKAST